MDITSNSFVLSHVIELRLLTALFVIGTVFALIKLVSSIHEFAKPWLAKSADTGNNRLSTTKLSVVGAR